MNGWLIAAAAASAATALIHIVPGGRYIARPLLGSSDLAKVPKYTHYYCWHAVSIVLLTMALGFVYCGFNPESLALAVMLTGLAGSFALWNGVLIIWKKLNPIHMPQWALFLPIATLGLIGLA